MYHRILQILTEIQEYVFADEKDKQINDNRQSSLILHKKNSASNGLEYEATA